MVLCADLELPANIYPWLAARERGLEVRMAPSTDDAIDVEVLIAATDERTRAISVSWVTFVPGYRIDLETLGRFYRERDVFLLVNATHACRALHTDVAELPIDGLAVSGHKDLLSFYEMGMFWYRRERAERRRSTHLGKPGVVAGDAHPDHNDYAVTLIPDARRFETRLLYVGAAALRTSCEYLTGFGTGKIEAHVTALSARLSKGLEGLGLAVNRDPFGQGPTQIVTVGALTSDGLHSTGDPVLKAVHDHLTANRVHLSARRGMLRFSFHLYNNAADVDRVFKLTEEALKRARGRRRVAAIRSGG